MKAAYLRKPYDLEICERQRPEPGAGEVLIHIRATAICGTDVAIYKGAVPVPGPVIQGHESVGVVEGIGGGVTGFAIGDPVIINPAFFCGDCFYCRKGLNNLCVNGGLIGRDRDGSFAEYLAISANNAVKLPADISFEDATTLQSLATVLRGWERVEGVRGVGPGDAVVVIGLGAPGLLLVRLAVLAGAKVFACTRSPWKLDIARKYGAVSLSTSEIELGEAVREATEGRGADLVIDAAGNPHTFQQAVDTARPGAVFLPFGILHDLNGVDAYNIYYKELTIVGTRAMNMAGYRRAVGLYQEGEVDLKPLVTDTFRLAETKEFFEKMDRESGRHLRMVCSID